MIYRIVSPVCQIEGGFLIYKWKNVTDDHRSRLLGDGSFRHPGQMLKWMDSRVSLILRTLIGLLFKTEEHKYVLHMPFLLL